MTSFVQKQTSDSNVTREGEVCTETLSVGAKRVAKGFLAGGVYRMVLSLEPCAWEEAAAKHGGTAPHATKRATWLPFPFSHCFQIAATLVSLNLQRTYQQRGSEFKVETRRTDTTFQQWHLEIDFGQRKGRNYLYHVINSFQL